MDLFRRFFISPLRDNTMFSCIHLMLVDCLSEQHPVIIFSQVGTLTPQWPHLREHCWPDPGFWIISSTFKSTLHTSIAWIQFCCTYPFFSCYKRHHVPFLSSLLMTVVSIPFCCEAVNHNNFVWSDLVPWNLYNKSYVLGFLSAI